MKEIVYLGFYNSPLSKYRKDNGFNPAGTMKMNYIIEVLKKLNYKVTVLSIMFDADAGFHKLERRHVDDQLDIVFIPYFAIKVFGRFIGRVNSSIFFLKHQLKRLLKDDSVIISYHALEYRRTICHLHSRVKFRWISEVEEIYNLSRLNSLDSKKVKKELCLFSESDAFIFVNDYLAANYSFGKRYVVSYGNYSIHERISPVANETINIAYTGIINKERGVFLLLDAISLLPSNYRLNVLGFGSSENMELFKQRMNEINQKSGYNKIFFLGTKSGNEFSLFLFNNDIGISLIDDKDPAIANNSFPSKILVYLGHGLRVISSNCSSITKSKVAPLLLFCENDPGSIANAIQQVNLDIKFNYEEKMRELEEDFMKDLYGIVEGY